jgi:hypothetical protein
MIDIAKYALRDAGTLAQERGERQGFKAGALVFTIDESLKRAIAAALIAAVERKPQFVQVSRYRFRPDRIEATYPNHDGALSIFLMSGQSMELSPLESTAFLLWQEQNANIIRLDAGDA